jgi:hypothetical protein
MGFCLSEKAIADSSLVLYLPLDEGKGDTVEDLSQYGNDGTINGTPEWVKGKSGNAIFFKGEESKAYIEIPHDDSLSLTKDHTIAYCIKWDGQGSPWCPCVTKRVVAKDQKQRLADNYCFWVGSDQVLDYMNDTSNPVSATTRVKLTDDWVFLAMTHDGKETISFYINGSFDSSQTIKATEANDGPISIGAGMYQWGDYGAGVSDEITIFNRALSAEEIEKLMTEGAKPLITPVESAGKLATSWGKVKDRY